MFHTLELRAGVPAQEGTRATDKKSCDLVGWSCGIHGGGAVDVILWHRGGDTITWSIKGVYLWGNKQE